MGTKCLLPDTQPGAFSNISVPLVVTRLDVHSPWNNQTVSVTCRVNKLFNRLTTYAAKEKKSKGQERRGGTKGTTTNGTNGHGCELRCVGIITIPGRNLQSISSWLAPGYTDPGRSEEVLALLVPLW